MDKYLNTIIEKLNEIEEDVKETKDYYNAIENVNSIITTTYTLAKYQLINFDTYNDISDKASNLLDPLEHQEMYII